MDAWCAPAVFARYFENEVTDLPTDAGSFRFPGLRLPFPEKTEAISMPFCNGDRLDKDQCVGPFRPGATESNPESLVGVLDVGSGTFVLVNSKLLSESKVF